DPAHRNDDGEHRIVPLPEAAPWIVLERQEDGDWALTRATIERVPTVYRQTFSPLSRALQTALPDTFYAVTLFGVALWQIAYAVVLLGIAWGVGRLANALLRSRVAAMARRAGLVLDAATWRRTTAPLVVLAMGLTLLWGIPDL